MKLNDPIRFHCPNCSALLVYRRQSSGQVVALHAGTFERDKQGTQIKPGKLPHTKRTLDRARREATCALVKPL